jgi:hypothetical protein
MKIALILAFAFTLTTGMALTVAFGFGLLPLGFWPGKVFSSPHLGLLLVHSRGALLADFPLPSRRNT